jgi:hypothetical protein
MMCLQLVRTGIKINTYISTQFFQRLHCLPCFTRLIKFSKDVFSIQLLLTALNWSWTLSAIPACSIISGEEEGQQYQLSQLKRE